MNKKCCANCGNLLTVKITSSNVRCSKCGYYGLPLPQIELSGRESETLFIEMANYDANKTKAVFIQSLEKDEDGGHWLEPYIEITTNLDGVEKILEENEIIVKTWSENESLMVPLLKSGYFEDTGKTVDVSQWCKASIWKVIKPIPNNIQPEKIN